MASNVENGIIGVPKDENAALYEDKHFLTSSKEKLTCVLAKNSCVISIALKIFFHAIILFYFAAAFYHWYQGGTHSLDLCNGFGLLVLIVSTFYWSVFYYKVLKPSCLKKDIPQRLRLSTTSKRWLRRILFTLPAVVFVVFLAFDTHTNPKRLVPLTGLATFLLCGFIFSKYPSKIRWTVIYRGVSMQILIAFLTIRWEVGRNVVGCIGQKAEQFVSYGYVGAAFVYSDNLIYKNVVFAFQSLSVIFFVGCVVEILFHYGVLQKMFVTWGWVLQTQMGTTAIESINCCASSFLGMSEAPLLIKSYLPDLTMSELQAVMLGGLSTVAGTVFAAYVSFGVNPGYLITASVMSAPAALSFSKLLYPETEESKTRSEHISISVEDESDGVLAAACKGALSCISMVQSVIANLIAFVSFVAFVNGVLTWGGSLVGVQNFTLDAILSKCFIPVTLLLGVDYSQSEEVARLIALKTTVNEFVAYQELGKLKELGKLSKRSEVIATYALCSFANPSSVGASIAILSSLCPQQKSNITKLAFRAFIGGTVTCFMTASIAALLMPDDYSMS